MVDITNAKAETKELYDYLKETANKFSDAYTKELDSIVNKLKKGVDNYSNSELRDFMIRISVESYSISLVQEQSKLMDSCAEALQDEEKAKEFTSAEGSVEAKKNKAIINTADRTAVKMLYDTVSGILKTRCDEAHRLVSVLNGILISRAADAKNNFNPRSEGDADVDFDVNSSSDIPEP